MHQELLLENFSVQRINDTIREAERDFEVQQGLKELGRQTDYSSILETCEEIFSLKDFAFQLRDEIQVLEEFYESSSEGIDTTEIDEVFSRLHREMRNERYEFVPELIEESYSQIIIAQSRLATLNVFYDATTRGLKRFFQERWMEFLIGTIILIVLFFVLKKPVERFILEKQLAGIEIRRQSLKGMISKNQDLYFNKGKMSEEAFNVKNKKLAELIRDIDRQISLLNEQIYALRHGKSLNKLKNKKNKAKKK